MEKLLEFLAEKLVYIILSVCVILATLFGKPKTAEKLEKARQNQKKKLSAKCKKQAQKLKETTAKLQEIEEKEK